MEGQNNKEMSFGNQNANVVDVHLQNATMSGLEPFSGDYLDAGRDMPLLHSTPVNTEHLITSNTLITVDVTNGTSRQENILNESSTRSTDADADRHRPEVNTEDMQALFRALTESIQRSMNAMKADINSKMSCLETKMSSLQTIQADMTNMKADMTTVKSEIEKVNTNMTHISDEVKNLRTELNSLDTKFTQQISQTSTEVDRKINEQVQISVHDMGEKLKGIMGEKFETLTHTYQQELSGIRETQENLQAMQKNTQVNLDNLQSEVAKLHSFCDDLPENVEKITLEVGLLKLEHKRINSDSVQLYESVKSNAKDENPAFAEKCVREQRTYVEAVKEVMGDKEEEILKRIGHDIRQLEQRLRDEIVNKQGTVI
ncbi:uncharacterized protein LOC126428001 [Schistocerca serialis cubense]|uniref:uncharacterized protein LOC126428001 n=1 Tax=Schistocerca serialis cubense TaxID=2023355 RepID=UPI00214EF136|nr:uncharacterized protein LOC126428001 [Schistocerca serialis cubense]